MADGAKSSSRDDMESVLRDAPETARDEHRYAKAECVRLQAVRDDLGGNHPDGLLAFRQAVAPR
jgi:hypothetical protein